VVLDAIRHQLSSAHGLHLVGRHLVVRLASDSLNRRLHVAVDEAPVVVRLLRRHLKFLADLEQGSRQRCRCCTVGQVVAEKERHSRGTIQGQARLTANLLV